MRTLLHDPVPEALERGAESARRRPCEVGREGACGRGRRPSCSSRSASLDELAPCDLVIEAAPERAELKRDLFGALSMVCGDDVVLATNTSSIPVTSLAGAAARPENVVGMHFFNPPPLMPLLEVIRAEQTPTRSLGLAEEVGAAMGKEVIVVADGPGFLVNRCGRPFGGEGLRLLQERIATHEQIDRICRLGGGFRMGPFELMDLVGIDVGFEVAKSFDELSFGEPRWRPSPIQARMVAAGRLGRRAGRGYYEYAEGTAPTGRTTRSRPQPGGGEGTAHDPRRRRRWRTRCASAPAPPGTSCARAARRSSWWTRAPGRDPLAPAERAARGAVRRRAVSRRAASPARSASTCCRRSTTSRLVELTRLPTTQSFACRGRPSASSRLGFLTEWVEDAPGLVLGRIVSQLVNEAAFAIGEGVGAPDDVDTGLTLGLSHPRGPVAWSEAIGLDHVLARARRALGGATRGALPRGPAAAARRDARA